MEQGKYQHLLLTLTDEEAEMVRVLKKFRDASPQEP